MIRLKIEFSLSPSKREPEFLGNKDDQLKPGPGNYEVPSSIGKNTPNYTMSGRP